MKLTWRENLLQFFSKNTNQFVTHFLIYYSFLDNYIETSGQRVSNRGFVSFFNIALICQYLTQISICHSFLDNYIQALGQGFRERDLSGGWTVGSVAGGNRRVSGLKKSSLVKASSTSLVSESHQRASPKSMTKEHHQRVSSKHHQRVSSQNPTKEHDQRASPNHHLRVSSKTIIKNQQI